MLLKGMGAKCGQCNEPAIALCSRCNTKVCMKHRLEHKLRHKPQQMLSRELGKIEAAAILTPMMPLTRWTDPVPQVDIAFDSEYQNDMDFLISYQFSGRTPSGELQTHVYMLNKKGGITHHEFLEMVFDVLIKLGHKNVPKQLFLISYAAAAELRYIQNYAKIFKLRETHKGLGWEGDFGEEIRFKAEIIYKGTRLTVIDLAGFYPNMRLAGVGDAVGYKKVEIEKLAPKHPEQYWKEHMVELVNQHPDVFEKYSRIDAEIALLGWEDLLRQWYPKHLDPHKYRTIPSLAMADFRQNWLQAPPVPVRYEAQLRSEKRAEGWSKTAPNVPVFDGDIDARYMALEAYWGGYNVAFIRGHMKFKPGEAFFYDFVSLYVASGILQPLPTAATKWLHGEYAKAHWSELEGFIRAYFEFPTSQQYPNLPVMHDKFAKLTFPLKGTTVCTIAEARVAVRLGAKITPEKVVGFIPTAQEKDHVFARFLKHDLEAKNKSKKNSLGYYSHKLTMVAAIGKLAERAPQYDTKLVQELLAQGVSADLIHSLWKSPTARRIFQSKAKAVGGAWMPEWASLILGLARSYAALVVANGCYHISTDGGIFPASSIEKALLLPEIKAMNAIGSGFIAEVSDKNPKGEVSEMVVIRTRMYGSWFGEHIVHNASHSVHLRGPLWNDMLRKGIGQKSVPAKQYDSMRLAKSKDIFFLGRATRHFDEIEQTLKISWHWDNKRFTAVSVEDPFNGFTTTHPWATIKDALQAEYPRKSPGRKRRFETDADRQRAYRLSKSKGL